MKKLCVLVTVLLVAGLSLVSQQRSYAFIIKGAVTTTGAWTFDNPTPSPGAAVPDGVAPADNGTLSSNTNIKSVAITGFDPHAFNFPGWKYRTPCSPAGSCGDPSLMPHPWSCTNKKPLPQPCDGTVDPTASSLTIPNAPKLNPGTPPQFGWTVRLGLASQDPDVEALTDGRIVASSGMSDAGEPDTLNIAQKGLAGGTNQQWKVSEGVKGCLPLGSSVCVDKVNFQCEFNGLNSSGVLQDFPAAVSPNVNPETHEKALGGGNADSVPIWYNLQCNLANGTITGILDTGGVDTTFSAPGPISVTNSAAVTVGKKPGSTNEGDAFAGIISYVRVGTGLITTCSPNQNCNF